MTDRPFAADGDPAVAPEPGYYPDPSIPGFVRYWGGSAWVPGTTRPAPAEGEVLRPPRYAARRPAPDLAAARAVPPPAFPVSVPPVSVPPVSVPSASAAVQASAQVSAPVQVAGPVHEPGPLAVSAPVALSASPERPELPVVVPAPSRAPSSSREVPGSGDTGPVYLDQTTGGASFVVGPRVAEVIGGPVFRTVEPSAEEASGAPGASGWQADPQAQRGLMETGGSARWVSWGVLPGAPEEEEGRAEGERAAVAVEVAGAAAPAVAVAVREVSATVEAVMAMPVVQVAAEPEESPVPVRVATRPVEAPAPVAGPAAPPAAPLPAVRPAREATVRGRSAAPAPAGLGRRLAARAVDTAVLLVVAVAAGIPLGGSVAEHLQQKLDQARMASSLARRHVQVWLVDDVVLGKLAALIGILVFVSLVYEVLPIARTGQTFGKRLARIRVVDATAPRSRARLSLGRSLLRWIVRQLGVVLLLGLVWPLFDRPARRGWQDRAARTRVVRG
ncbi:RDD family protein [Kitasatospora sp. NPDC101157]|uniref:RDD family protein n=1 Tax=Kitasatospora sp. NPDC101157 TaxID=3364098 RepID=UPI00380DAF43